MKTTVAGKHQQSSIFKFEWWSHKAGSETRHLAALVVDMYLHDALSTLGLSLHSTMDELKRAYKKGMVESHPDKSSDPNAHDKAQLINEAKVVLVTYYHGSAYASAKKRMEASYRMKKTDSHPPKPPPLNLVALILYLWASECFSFERMQAEGHASLWL